MKKVRRNNWAGQEEKGSDGGEREKKRVAEFILFNN